MAFLVVVTKYILDIPRETSQKKGSSVFINIQYQYKAVLILNIEY